MILEKGSRWKPCFFRNVWLAYKKVCRKCFNSYFYMAITCASWFKCCFQFPRTLPGFSFITEYLKSLCCFFIFLSFFLSFFFFFFCWCCKNRPNSSQNNLTSSNQTMQNCKFLALLSNYSTTAATQTLSCFSGSSSSVIMLTPPQCLYGHLSMLNNEFSYYLTITLRLSN